MKTVLKNCRLIDGIVHDIIDSSYLVIENEEIKEIGLGQPSIQQYDQMIDCEGKYVLPGLIDCHVHLVWDGSEDPQGAINHEENDVITLGAYKHALDTLKLGITSVRDVGSPDRTVLHVRNAINEKLLQGPTIISSGAPICMTGGHVHYLGYESDGEDEVRKNTRQVLKEGADLVKVMATGGIYTHGEEPGSPQLTLEELKAAKEEASKKNKKVAAHADGLEGIMNCLEAGIDTIEHGIYADDHALQLMKERGTYLVPTMIVMEQLANSSNIPDWALRKAKEIMEPHQNMLQEAIRAGVKIATGTDCGAPETPPEYFFKELLLLNEAGMSPMEVIHASTRVAADCIGAEDRGVLAEGKKADLLIVEENPLENLEVLKAEKQVMKNGAFIHTATNRRLVTS